MPLEFYRDEAGDPRARGEGHDLLADFLESDVQGSAAYGYELLTVVEALRKGRLEEWSRSGNAYTVTLTAEGALIEPDHEDTPPHEVSLAELRDAIAGWLEFLESGGRPS